MSEGNEHAQPPVDEGQSSKLRSMLSDSFYLAFGIYATYIFSLLINVILTRRLSEDTFGLFQVLLSFYMISTMLLSLGGHALIERYIPELSARGNRRGVIRLTIFGALIHLFSSGVICIFFWFAQEWIAGFYNISLTQLQGVLPYFLLFTILRWEAFVLDETLTAHRCQKYRNIMLFIFQGSKWALFYFLLPQDGSIVTVMIFLVLSNAFILLAFAGRVLGLTRRVPDETQEPLPVRRMTRFGLLRYTTSVALIGFFPHIDIQFISHFHDPVQAGFYGLATKMVEMLSTLVPNYYLLKVIIPVYVKEYTRNKDPRQLIRVFCFYNKVVTAFLAPVYIGSLILAVPLIAEVFDPKFLPAVTAFRLYFTGSFIYFFLNTSGFLPVILERPEFTLYSRIFVIYNIGMDILLIPRYGIEGAAVATGSAMVFGYILTYYLIRRVIAIRIPWLATLRTFIYTGVMALAILPFQSRIDSLGKLLLVVALGALVYGLLAWRLPVFNHDERERLNIAFGRKVFPL